MGTEQFDPALLQPQPQGVAVSRLVLDEPLRLRPRTARDGSRDSYLLERRLDERDFRRGHWGNVNSQRYTLAVCHHHELYTLPRSVLPMSMPIFAGEKASSLNASSHDRMPSSSSSPRNFLQRSRQASASSHSSNRRQHVAGDGYCAGKSFQRAPLRSTHRMPSKQRRSSTRLRPSLFEDCRFGLSGSIFGHYSSVSLDGWRLIERLLSISLVVVSPCGSRI